jgi:hypothetical protein
MDFSVILAGLAALILVIILIRLAAKNLFKIVAVSAVIIALAVYLFVVFGNADEDIQFVEIFTEYTLEDLSNLYCTNSMSRTDSLKCHCIVQPLRQDMQARHSLEELESLQTKRIKYAAEITKSFRNQKDLIKSKLKENNATHLLKDFSNDLKDKAKFLN